MATTKSFATLLRQSKFIAQGDFRNSTTVGKVFHTTTDDLYIDLGMKFHAVVKKPREDARLYVRGSTVRVRLLDCEIADRFIGTEKMTSLLEADAVLLGLESTPKRFQMTNKGLSRGMVEEKMIEILANHIKGKQSSQQAPTKGGSDAKEEDAEELYQRYENIRFDMDDPNECYHVLKNSLAQTLAKSHFISILQHPI